MRSDYSAQDLDAILELAATVQKQYTDVPDQYKAILHEWVVSNNCESS